MQYCFHNFDPALQIRNQGRRRSVFHFGLLVNGFGGKTALEPQLRLLHTLAARSERTTHDGKLVIQSHQLKIGRRNFRDESHTHRTPILDRREILRPRPCAWPSAGFPKGPAPN